jgi:hypothetical protein
LGRTFDVIIAEAVVEHIADPVSAIGFWARIAKEAVLIPFTTIFDTDDLVMKTITQWDDSSMAYAWWELSRGLYERVFDNLGFDVRFVQNANAIFHSPDGDINGIRPSIIATRR